MQPSPVEESSFLALPEVVRDALAAQEIVSPTPVQQDAIPPIMEGRDLLALAQTGSGKTLAFTLPVGAMLAGPSEHGLPRALVLTPTRELANQIEKVFSTTLSGLGLRCLSIIGGDSYGKQKYALRSGVDVVVGTPGRIGDLAAQHALKLEAVSFYVLDEVDQMLDFGFSEELNKIQEHLPEEKQTLLFSATMNRSMEGLAQRLLREPVTIKLADQATSPSSIEHGYIAVQDGRQLQALTNLLLLDNPSQALIFCETRQDCRDVSEALEKRGLNAAPISGDLTQDARQATLERFRNGFLQYLVATNVAARGLDIQGLPLVINLEVPLDRESYTHRVGRTGRAGESGRAWTIVTKRAFGRYLSFMKTLDIWPTRIEVPPRHEVLSVVAKHELNLLKKYAEDTSIRHIRRVSERLLAELTPEEAMEMLSGFLRHHLSSIEVHEANEITLSEEALRRRPKRHQRGRQSGPRRGGFSSSGPHGRRDRSSSRQGGKRTGPSSRTARPSAKRQNKPKSSKPKG